MLQDSGEKSHKDIIYLVTGVDLVIRFIFPLVKPVQIVGEKV
jgi:hypothetical protein